MQIDDPYQTPKSALEPEEPRDPLSRMEEGIVDYMAASRIRTIVFIVIAWIGGVASLGGIVVSLASVTFYGDYDDFEVAGRAVVWAIALFHFALVAFSLTRYLSAINQVARTYDRRDLNLAIRRRRFARVGWFVMIAMMIISLLLPGLYLE